MIFRCNCSPAHCKRVWLACFCLTLKHSQYIKALHLHLHHKSNQPLWMYRYFERVMYFACILCYHYLNCQHLNHPETARLPIASMVPKYSPLLMSTLLCWIKHIGFNISRPNHYLLLHTCFDFVSLHLGQSNSPSLVFWELILSSFLRECCNKWLV
jgi:hypothetical protein